MSYWGYHLVLDCAGLNAESIRDPQNIYKFTKQLVKDIDMVAFGSHRSLGLVILVRKVIPLSS
jgi:hypothetical protein